MQLLSQISNLTMYRAALEPWDIQGRFRMLQAAWDGPQLPRFSVSLPGPALSLPNDTAHPCFLLLARDIWFPAPVLGGCRTSSSWDISCFPPSSLLKIAMGVNTGRHMGL